MFVVMIIGLYTSRVILNALGVEDYGINNVVGGIIVILSFITSSFSQAIVRFFTFEVGKKNAKELNKLFSISLIIFVFLSILLILLAETIGLWFLKNKLVIAPERQNAAFWLFQFSLFTLVVNIINIPFNALIISHERMNIFAYFSIVEVILKLAVALLTKESSHDKLISFGLLIFLSNLITVGLYIGYSKRVFKNIYFRFVKDKKLFKDIISFTSWSLYGTSSVVIRGEGTNILINIFSGVAVNAARGISFQVNSSITKFQSSFMNAINPQIIKSYAQKNYDYLFNLIYKGAKFSFFLLFFLSLPILFNTNIILVTWLKLVPEHTINFIRLILVFSLIESLSSSLITAQLATGRIRNYQLIIGTIQMLNLPVSYVFLKNGFQPEITIIIFIFFSICSFIARLIFLKRLVNLSIKQFLKNVVFKVFLVLIISIPLPLISYLYLQNETTNFFVTSSISAVITLYSIYTFGCTPSEHLYIKEKSIKIFKKIIFHEKN